MYKRLFVVLLLAASGFVCAGNISGRVEDVAGNPLSFVTISLLSSDSVLITGTITDDNGVFSIELPKQASILRASFLGYTTQCRTLNGQEENIIIRMQEETTRLDEVVVVMNRAPLVERRLDKIVVNVASSPFAVGNNGKDILKKAPGVHIDRKGKITVNGKAVEVYIDGRPSDAQDVAVRHNAEAPLPLL